MVKVYRNRGGGGEAGSQKVSNQNANAGKPHTDLWGGKIDRRRKVGWE